MGEAIIFSILCIFAVLGIQKLFEMIETVRMRSCGGKAVVVYKLDENPKDVEMIVRSLAGDSISVTTGKEISVFVLEENLDEQTAKICKDTAKQYQNVFVGKLNDLEAMLTK